MRALAHASSIDGRYIASRPHFPQESGPVAMAGEHIFVSVECEILNPLPVRKSAASRRVNGVSSVEGEAVRAAVSGDWSVDMSGLRLM
jgi:hypothetical protein